MPKMAETRRDTDKDLLTYKEASAEEKDRNSAATLSIWHCILASFFMNAEHKHLVDDEHKKLMLKIFGKMRTLRKIIHDKDDVDDHVKDHSSSTEFIKDHAQNVTEVVKKIPRARWAEEMSSMMHELLAMHRILKDHKHRLRINSGTHNQGRRLASMITLWYWLAAWSAKLEDLSEKAKDDFLDTVEHDKNNADLANHLFETDKTESKPIKGMMHKLLVMLKADPDHWIHVLEHFTESMIEAGSMREHVKATAHATSKALEMMQDQTTTTSLGLTLDPKIIRPVTGTPLRSLFRSSIVSDSGQHSILDVVHELKEPIGKAIEQLPDTVTHLVDQAAHMEDKAIGFGQDVVDKVSNAAKTVYNDVKGAIATVHHEVSHLLHGIGEGAQKFANATFGWFKHIF